MSLLTNSVFYSIIFYIIQRGDMMKCQNCGFESADKICSICGAEIVEVQEDKAQEVQILPSNDENKPQTDEIKRPKIRIKKILLFALIIILSAAVVSASSIAFFYYCTNDNNTRFFKLNQTVNCGDFSITLKEVKTPEFTFDYYPQIVYDLVFEFHNNTNQTLIMNSPQINGVISCEGGDSGYFIYDYAYYEVSGKTRQAVSFDIPERSDFDITVRLRYEDFSNYVSSSFVYDYAVDLSDDTENKESSTDDEAGADDEDNSDNGDSNGDDSDENIVIDKSKIKYKKEHIQKYKEGSPERFYMIVSDVVVGSGTEEQYARFMVEPDKESIVIPESENIE